MKRVLILLIGMFLVSSCVTTDRCSVKINKKKFAYYNKLQYGGNAYANKNKKKR
jgi:hypothetical protein